MGGLKLTRAAVFIDYENARFVARKVFSDPTQDPCPFAHVLPRRLGLMLTQHG